MVDTVLLPEEITLDLIRDVLDDASVSSIIDSNGRMSVTGHYRFFVFVNPLQCTVQFLAVFSLKPGRSSFQQYSYFDKIHVYVAAIRAGMLNENSIAFSYEVFTDAGLSRRQIVNAIKRFDIQLHMAIVHDSEGIIE